MDKMKVHELAAKLNIEENKLIKLARDLKIDVKSRASYITEEEIKKIEKNIKGVSKIKSMDNKKEKNNGPVIIRRAVIINDEEEKKEEKNRKEQAKKKDVGFVENKKNKDYNIVYRDKPTKPLTVSELLGFAKKDKAEEEKTVKEEITEKPAKAEVKEEVTTVVTPSNDTVTKTDEVKAPTASKEKESKPRFENNRRETQNNNNNNNNNFRDNRNNNNFRDRNNNNNYRDRNNNNGNYSNNRDNNGNNNGNGFRKNNFNNRNNNNSSFNNGNGNNSSFNRNNNGPRQFNKDGNNNNRFDNNRNNGPKRDDNRGIDKKIKNIMDAEIPAEKEIVRDFTNKAKDKAKLNRRDEQNNKKNSSRKNSGNEIDADKLNNLKKQNKLSNMFDGGEMLDYYDLTTERGRRSRRKPVRQENRTKQKIFKLTEIAIPEHITVKDLAAEMKITSGDVIKKLLTLGIMATINNDIDFDTAFLIAQEYGINVVKKEVVTDEDILIDDTEDTEDELKPRPPVIVVMGHVDHGKTSLLDAIRSTNVIEGESGGITQHIGAYQVKINGRDITFLDTPGHEAFTSMRARGAMITDIAILVVAANDGVMPQTVEAINHAKAAEIPIIVAVNKMDLPDANFEKVQQELMKYELVPEAWGGDTIYVPISAKKREGIDNLLEMVLLEADVLELKANPTKQSKGTVIEARLDKTRGPVATMLVQRGKLDVGDTIIVGSSIGRIRTMSNDKGKKVKTAGPSTPVEITGLTSVPESGDTFYEVKDERTAKHLIEKRKNAKREKEIASDTVVTLDDLFNKIESEHLKQLNLIVKADVQGSVEALKQSLEKLSNDEVRVKVIHSNVGGVTESDVTLAKVSGAIIIAFNVRPEVIAKTIADKDGVDIKQYSVIYDAINDVESAMKGMLDPVFKEVVIGTAEIRQTFKVSNVGTIAGSYVLTGKLARNAGIRIIRDNIVIHDGKLVSLKRFKDDVKEVDKGYECGLQVDGFNDLKEGDQLEVYIMEQVK